MNELVSKEAPMFVPNAFLAELGIDEGVQRELHKLYEGWIDMTADEKRERAETVCNFLSGWAHTQKMLDNCIPQDLLRSAEIDLAYRLGSADTPGTCMRLYGEALSALKQAAQKAAADIPACRPQ